MLYTTQTRLAREIAQTYYNNIHYVFAAPEFDAKENHPTSNPKVVRDRWCQEINSPTDRWDEHRETLRSVAQIIYKKGDITKAQYEAIQDRILNSSASKDAVPIVYCIAVPIDRRHPSDFTDDDYPKNQEYIIPDLKLDPIANEVHFNETNCDEMLNAKTIC